MLMSLPDVCQLLKCYDGQLYKVGGSSFEVLVCILPRHWYQMLGLDPQPSLSAVSVDLRPSEEAVVGPMDREPWIFPQDSAFLSEFTENLS